MRVMCINKNGWHQWNGNYYAFVEPMPTEFGGMEYQQHADVQGSAIDLNGDMLYIIDEIGFEADQFVPLDENEEEMVHEDELFLIEVREI